MTEHDVSHLPREARPFQGQPAGLVSRLIAAVVDGLVVAAALGASYLGINGLFFFLDPRSFHFREPIPVLSLTAALVLSVIYLWVAWAWLARTIGCQLMGLRVLGRRGRRIGALVALGRAILCVLFPIGLAWCVVNPRFRSVQDILLRTSVVYDWMPHPPLRE